MDIEWTLFQDFLEMLVPQSRIEIIYVGAQRHKGLPIFADGEGLQAKAVREKTKIGYCSGLANGEAASKFRTMITMSSDTRSKQVSSYERISTC